MPPLVFIYGDDVGISKDIWDIWEISIVPAHHNQMDRGKNVTAWLPKPDLTSLMVISASRSDLGGSSGTAAVIASVLAVWRGVA